VILSLSEGWRFNGSREGGGRQNLEEKLLLWSRNKALVRGPLIDSLLDKGSGVVRRWKRGKHVEVVVARKQQTRGDSTFKDVGYENGVGGECETWMRDRGAQGGERVFTLVAG